MTVCRLCLYLLLQALQGCNLRPDATSIKKSGVVTPLFVFRFVSQLHPMYKKIYPPLWRSLIAPIIRLHFDFRCAFCNVSHASLHVHHIDADTENNSLSNLIALCPRCHRKAEMKQIKFCQLSRGGCCEKSKRVEKQLKYAIDKSNMLRAKGKKTHE